ncbi:unnamed protein product, partial [Medioppia subpectinata]
RLQPDLCLLFISLDITLVVPNYVLTIVKRRQASKWFNSPTDAFLSPCTQKLMKPKHDNQQVIQPLDLDDDRKHQSVVLGAQGVIDTENAMH